MVVEDADKQNNIKEYTMQFTQEMMLHSDSGYCMPFEERNGDVQMSLGYGKQKHPQTGETFFNHGVDFKVNNYLLSAVATGKVTGLGNDAVHGIYQVTRYGDYEVIYSHLSNVFANYGKEVKAGQVIAVSGSSLHIEVKYKGEELNPLEFLTMIYSNLKVMEQHGRPGAAPQFVTLDMDVRTAYDKDQKEIEDLMMRFFPDYMTDMSKGIYVLPEHTELALRNIFTMSAMKHYFFETIPSMANPLGMGAKSIPIAERVQILLIADFLNYLALRHQIFLSSMSAVEKKTQDRAIATSGLVDPLAGLEIDVQSFDIPRLVSVYPDKSGIRWWTKAWFNNSEAGESAIEIERELAIKFINDNIEKDAWLEEYFPKQMEVYHNAIEQTREQILNQLNL
jgi:hypothetical protein